MLTGKSTYIHCPRGEEPIPKHFRLACEINARIPSTHPVMHGSYSVPQYRLAIINQYGGAISETYGVPVEEIVEGIKQGVRTVNTDRDLRMSSASAIRKFPADNS